jgi:hypothetical protein
MRLNSFFNSLAGGGIDKRNAAGETRLYRAVRDGNAAAVKKLLRAGADPDIPDNRGMTPLHQAAYWGEAGITGMLLQAGAAPNVDNGKGWTPLHSAALAGGMKSRGDIIRRLKAAGAKEDIADKHGWTARDYMQLWEENAHAAEKLKHLAGQDSGGAIAPEGQHGAQPPAPGSGAKPCSPPAPRH